MHTVFILILHKVDIFIGLFKRDITIVPKYRSKTGPRGGRRRSLLDQSFYDLHNLVRPVNFSEISFIQAIFPPEPGAEDDGVKEFEFVRMVIRVIK